MMRRGLILTTIGLLAFPASAAATTVTFGPGSVTWTVPNNVSYVSVEAIGGSGGRDGAVNSSCTPGKAADGTGTALDVVPGEPVYIAVGTKGGDASGPHGGAGGSNGGGAGGSVTGTLGAIGGGGGGGATFVSDGAQNWYVGAGGGGGCGGFASSSGGNGGDATTAGADGSGGPDGKAGGGASFAGAGGKNVPVDGTAGQNGASNQGGAGYGSSSFFAGGGGGGGGVLGGAGGGAAAGADGSGGGGGGGSFYSTHDGLGSWNETVASSLGDGSVTITYAPQPAPDTTTGPASSVTDTTATVAGTVNPNGLATTYHVDYGTDPNYGRRTADGSAGNGYFAANVSGSLTGLQPATVYHYRLVATSASGTTYGVDQTFETTAPPVVSTGPASGVTDTAANVAGTLNAEGLSTRYHFDYGTTGSYGHATADVSATARFGAQPASASLAGLQAGMAYHYRLVATNSSGTSYGLDQVLHTTGAPVAVTGGPDYVGGSTATVAGVVNSDGLSTTYRFEYGTSTAYGLQTVDVAAAGGFADEAVKSALGQLQPGTVYHYRLVAVNASGTSDGADQMLTTNSAGGTTGGTPHPRAEASLTFVGKPIFGRRSVSYTLACSNAPCHVSGRLTAAEQVTRAGGRVVALAAGGRAKTRRVAVIVGSASVLVTAGRRLKLTVSLNGVGRGLLGRFKRLPATLSISLGRADGSVRIVKTASVVFLVRR
jgi:hypothetical protein